MSLKLFRSTGYSSILSPGETRVLMHPGWMAVAVSVWAGFACNATLWRAMVDGTGLGPALLSGWLVAAAAGLFLSVLGWRRTLRPAASLVLLLAAASAASVWSRATPLDGHLFTLSLGSWLPTWASLLGWQVPTLLTLLGVLPMLWVWSTDLRRTAGPAQMRANLSGAVLAVLLGAAALYLLGR